MTIDTYGICYHTTKVYSFVFNPTRMESKHYWLGVLNSKVLWYFLSSTGYVLRGGFFTFKTNYLTPFPVPNLDLTDPSDKEKHDEIAAHVVSMLSLKAKPQGSVPPAMIDALEQKLNSMVYKLYGLSLAEIAVVEGKG